MGVRRDAEAELNLPPGFRFHPTDEELVVHYLGRKVIHNCLPLTIIADVDLYKYDPWQLPEKALFGEKEWYFFTPRDRKYPNGSRPNRAAGSGYWKATGADKSIQTTGTNRHVGIKKALVFYTGKAPKGIKTNWIMHEYRLADTNHRRGSTDKMSSRLDDWVLCRLYNKKNRWAKTTEPTEETMYSDNSNSFEAIDERKYDSHGTPESEIINDVATNFDNLVKSDAFPKQSSGILVEDKEWFTDLNLDDLQSSLSVFGATSLPEFMPEDYYSCHFFQN